MWVPGNKPSAQTCCPSSAWRRAERYWSSLNFVTRRQLGEFLVLKTNSSIVRTSSLNWSPVPSKQSIMVRWECVGGMISSRWYLFSMAVKSDWGEIPSGESPSESGESSRSSSSLRRRTLLRRGFKSLLAESDMPATMGKLSRSHLALISLFAISPNNPS